MTYVLSYASVRSTLNTLAFLNLNINFGIARPSTLRDSKCRKNQGSNSRWTLRGGENIDPCVRRISRNTVWHFCGLREFFRDFWIFWDFGIFPGTLEFFPGFFGKCFKIL